MIQIIIQEGLAEANYLLDQEFHLEAKIIEGIDLVLDINHLTNLKGKQIEETLSLILIEGTLGFKVSL